MSPRSFQTRKWFWRAAVGVVMSVLLVVLWSQLSALEFAAVLFVAIALGSPALLIGEILRHNAKMRRIEAYENQRRRTGSDHLDPSFHAARSMIYQSSQAYWQALAAHKMKTIAKQQTTLSGGLDPAHDQPPGARNYIIKPKNGEAYWLRCNRHIEANRYCQRVHPDGYEIALWDDDLHGGMKLVDLIGES